MNANLQSLQSLAAARRDRGVGGVDTLQSLSADLSALKGGGAARQGFSTWMSQYMGAPQTAPTPAHKATATPPTELKHSPTAQSQQASRQPTEAPRSTAQKSQKPANTADRQAAAKAEAAQVERQRANARHAQARTDATKDATPTQAQTAEQADEAEGGRDTTFATAQGEGAAWVKELQPPAEVSTSDPNAMLAWLASLTQGELPATQDPAAGDAGNLAGADQAGRSGGRGAGALPTGAASLSAAGSTTALQAASTEETLRQPAEAAGPQGAQESSPLEFQALMTRELWRPAAGGAAGATPASHHTATLSTPVDSPDFAQALAERVGLWVSGPATEGPMTAELRLNPAEMGPIHIRITLEGQSAQVDFAAAHAETRQALEASMPALSGALEQAGLSLSGGGVSDQGGRQAWEQPTGPERGLAWGSRDRSVSDQDGEGALPAPARPATAARRPGGLDLYA